MKIALAVHGYPPELIGGTESSAEVAARGLAQRGHEVLVIAGSLAPAAAGSADVVESREGGVRVLRVRRGDLYFDHWHKSASPAAARVFRDVLARERPDVLHVHHWIRLSRDLVACAARERIPAVVTLHDLWTSCLIAFRVRPPKLEACDVPLAPHPCIACAAVVGFQTPWVPLTSAALLLGERQSDLARELALARVILVPSASHRAALEQYSVLAPHDARVRVLAPRPPVTAAELGGERTPRAAPARGQKLVLGAWGHLMPHKGQDLLIAAVAKLAPRFALELHLAGDEADPAFARELRARAAGLPVRFHGPFRTSALARHAVADVHAFVSGARGRESYSLVLDEARALGLPAVVPDRGAWSERAAAGGALVYASGDADALAAALARLFDEPETWQRLAAEGAALARAAADPAVWFGALQDAYARALAAGAPPIGAEPWFESRMRQEFLDTWDRAVRARAAEVAPLRPHGP